MNAPTDTEHGPGPAGQDPEHEGPRVTRDEVRDLGRLRRSRSDRKVAGVAGGIARHLDIDPLLVRVAFVILTFFGGGGLILYGVAWLLVPEEHTDDAVIRVDEGVRTAALIIAGVIAIASMVGDSLGGPDFPWQLLVIGLVFLVIFGGRQARKDSWPRPGSPVGGPQPGEVAVAPTYPGYRPGPPPPARMVDPRRRGPLLFPFTVALAAFGVGVVGTLHLAGVDVAPSAYPATVLGVVGLMLVVGAFYGRAGGLILIGLIAAGTTAVTSVVDDVEMGQLTPTPTSASDLKSDYDLGIGEIVIDLTKVEDLDALDDRTLNLDVSVGHIEVIVPDDGLRVEVDATIEAAGEVILFGNKSDTDEQASNGDPDDPTLKIDAAVLLGQIDVHTAKDAA